MNWMMLNIMVTIIMAVHESVQTDETKRMDDHRLVRVMFDELFNTAAKVNRTTEISGT